MYLSALEQNNSSENFMNFVAVAIVFAMILRQQNRKNSLLTGLNRSVLCFDNSGQINSMANKLNFEKSSELSCMQHRKQWL